MLSHNIKFTSDIDYQECENAFRNMNANTKERCFAGHASFLQHSITRIENAEFEKMGQGLMMGRYALHFHLAGDQRDSYLKHNAVHRGVNRCITLHGAFNTLLEGNVCLDNRGHNIYLEDGIEAGNRIINNLVVNPKTSGTICTDKSQSGLWITNPNNTFTGNAIVGAVFGAWFTFPTADGAHPFSGDKPGQLGGIFGASKNYYMDQASGFGPDSWVVQQEQARTPAAGFNSNSFKGSQSGGITIDFRVYDSEDPQIPCFEGSAYSRGPCPTCASVGHTFTWGPMSFDPDVLPSERKYQPVANLWQDIVIAYTAQTGAHGESFSFWATGGSVKFERAIFVDNDAGTSLGFTGECAAGVTFNAAGYQAEWSNALFLKGKPAFKLYDGGYSCTGCRWAELESVVTMRPGSPGNVNGVLFQSSAPLGWFDADASDPLYKWVFDSGRVQMEPKAASISNMVDWSSQFLLGPTWQSADVNIMTVDGFGDALQLGFLQLKYSGKQFTNFGWGRGAEVEPSPKCRHFYPCNRGMWCGDGRTCDPFVRCADIPSRPSCCLDEWIGQR
jgi:parallel beta-helix repeat protein